MTERETSFLILQRIELFGSYSTGALANQSGFVREVVRGVLRWRLRLDFLAEQLSSRTLKKIDQRALQILRVALYEMTFLSTAKYAVVDEAVSLAARHAKRARGFVNAVLRNAAGKDLAAVLPGMDDPDRTAVELSHPRWLLEKWTAVFGSERARAIAAANQEKSTADLLINQRVLSVREAEALLERRGVPFTRSELVPGVLRLAESSSAVRPEIDAGLFHPMDEGSALVASLAAGKETRVLDAAAAPGGKSLWLSTMGTRVVSHDLSVARLATLRRTFRRFGAKDQIVAGDASRPPFRGRFDTVLLDAPCSGTGTLRKNPEIKWRLDPGCFREFAERQRLLLSRVLDLAAKQCIYSTCSLEPEENDAVIERILALHRDFEREDLGDRVLPGVRRWVQDGVLRLTPDSGADGFTAFLLRRRQ